MTDASAREFASAARRAARVDSLRRCTWTRIRIQSRRRPPRCSLRPVVAFLLLSYPPLIRTFYAQDYQRVFLFASIPWRSAFVIVFFVREEQKTPFRMPTQRREVSLRGFDRTSNVPDGHRALPLSNSRMHFCCFGRRKRASHQPCCRCSGWCCISVSCSAR